MDELRRWLGLLGLASILAFAVGLGLPLLLGRPVTTPTQTVLLNVLFLTGAFRIFYPIGWRPLLGVVAIVVVLTYVHTFPVMNTDAALWTGWIAILAVALAVWLYDKRRASRSA